MCCSSFTENGVFLHRFLAQAFAGQSRRLAGGGLPHRSALALPGALHPGSPVGKAGCGSFLPALCLVWVVGRCGRVCTSTQHRAPAPCTSMQHCATVPSTVHQHHAPVLSNCTSTQNRAPAPSTVQKHPALCNSTMHCAPAPRTVQQHPEQCNSTLHQRPAPCTSNMPQCPAPRTSAQHHVQCHTLHTVPRTKHRALAPSTVHSATHCAPALSTACSTSGALLPHGHSPSPLSAGRQARPPPRQHAPLLLLQLTLPAVIYPRWRCLL